MELRLSHSVILISSLFISANAFTIQTQPQVVILKAGKEVKLECAVDSSDGKEFNALYDIFEWRKRQNESDQSGVSVTISANLDDRFKATNRYASSLDSQNPKLLIYTLTISNVQDVDSGWYRCQVKKNSTIVQSVQHKVSVISPVDHLILRGFEETANKTEWIMPSDPAIVDTTPAQLDFSEDTAGYLECIAVGGYPSPVVRILIGDMQINGQLSPVGVTSLVGDTLGLQKIEHVTRLQADNFRTTADHDGDRLTCKSEVRNQVEVVFNKTVFSRLNVQGAPVFRNCSQEVQYPLGSIGASIKCSFFAKPQHTSVTWHGIFTNKDVSGTAVPGNTETQRAFTQAQSGDYMYEAVLQFPKLVRSDFQSYILTVRNAIGEQQTTIKLSEGAGPGSTEVRENAADQSSRSSFLFILILLTAIFMQ
ncbi:hypothetical protein CAPTEDRAFT_223352 [Capitella teleta]|uniref:Ig-like domain-containing protein n=1 Tax=Capitella teleta TaxID=283909 RepID=R7U285_CAPTE|nr:hypothetical protein CAPTEDRAFT_223352 [Capitella teleta]|eukprot:ELT97280.1 hypothetical protein CAPTEDRAFT_223352 [Capitella teleta]